MSAAVSLGRDYRSILDQKISAGSRSAAAVIEAIHRDAPTDQIAKASSFRFRQAESFGVEIVDRESTYGYSISDHALNQAAERAGIPAAYVRELARAAGDEGSWKPELAAQILNQHFAHSEGRILARSVRGQLRGVLSDRYRRLDSRPLVDALATEAQAVGAIPIDGIATETRVALKVILPDTFEPIPGEVMALGAEWSNSDFGNGTHSIRAFALRVVCLNGMTRENLMRQIHLGGRLHDSIEYSDRTHRLDTATSVSALKDVVRGALGPKGVEDLMGQIRASHAKGMEGGALKASLRALPKSDVKTIVDAFESQDVINLPPGNTAWRASNAVSWVARHTEDAEKRLDMERIAGSLV
jgi:hypothetical protein